MNCSACGTAVDPSQRFCPKCGALVGQDPTAPDPLIGTKIGGKYQIVKLLGEGGMGSVYEGEQSLGTKVRRVAIKTLHPHLSKDPKVLTRFQREVGTLSELDHPNTIQVFDFGSTAEGQLYIVMEFVQGPALADVLAKGGAIEPDRAEKILAQICGSLEEAHAHGIIHRDLKPENVVLTERAGKKDFVKVLDFGIAKRGGEEDKNEQKLTQQGMVLGTPPYMSPEQFTGKPIDARSDVYALGVMAYEMLTGTLPFKAESAWEWATQHMTVPPIAMDSTPQGKRVPERMRLAITRALAKNPDDRWPGVKEFFDAFSGVSGAAAIGAAGPVQRSGTAPIGGAAVAMGAAGAPREKTQLAPAAPDPSAFGAMAPPQYSPGMAPAQGTYPSPGPGGAPYAAAAQGYRGPAGIPQAPPRSDGGGGGGRGLLFALLGLVGIGSIVLIVFALRGGTTSHQNVDLGPLGSGAASPPTQPTQTAGAADTSTTPAAFDSTLPPLPSTAKPPPTHAPPRPNPNPGPAPAPTPHPTTPPEPTPTQPPAPPPPPPPPPPKEPSACAAARQMKALGRVNEYNSLAAQCRAQGGTA